MNNSVYDSHEEAQIEKEEDAAAIEENLILSCPKEYDPDLYRDDPDNPYVEAMELENIDMNMLNNEDEIEVRVLLKEDDAYQIAESGHIESVRLAYELLRDAIKSQVFGKETLY